MNLQTMLNEKGMTMYHLSKVSGVPKTTVINICSGKSEIDACKARTVQRLAKTLGCTMDELMQIDAANYRRESGLPKGDLRFEKGLPTYLEESIDAMISSWKIKDAGGKDIHWDLNWCDLNADINSAETEQEISSEQAWYLREKYLRLERP
jgi:transcriptional regulator with XRE-family HTH domain